MAGLLTEPNSVALGDFNDPLGTPTLAQFAGHVNLYEAHLPPSDRYTYIFNGLSEPLDHFIMTPELDRYFLEGGPLHINADFPEQRTPDAADAVRITTRCLSGSAFSRRASAQRWQEQ